MKGWIRWTWTGCCVVALALGGPLAHAEGGRITFSGQIVTSTCELSAGGVPGMGSSRSSCGEVGTAPPSSFYRQSVVPLEGEVLMQDRLLAYLVNYAGAENARLIVRAYD
ncbi:hypothetical protein [Dyella silvae]|uniref:hypothetical protein n=1 Tax=Dyella silvae TaxID=2994424 RepID=UPI002265173A|nr:hypothetical protein [Dyella silvae]